MPPSISLSIQINSPCHENWENMEPTDQGRFCNSCQKTVVDLTSFTDQEIFQYFIKNPFPVCGRMHSSQKDRRYEHSTPKINRNLSSVAASLLTLAIITAEAAPPTPLKANITQAQLAGALAIPLPTDSIVISGTVKNKQGLPLENVEIVFMESKTLSDKNGYFQFTLPTPFNKTAVIQFSYPGLDKEVRSYHPVMGSASYEVTLLEPYFPVHHFMGNIVTYVHLPDSLSFLPIPRTSNNINRKCKAFLTDLAQFIREHPNQTFSITPLYKTSKKKAVHMSTLVMNYLVNEEGILQDRILLADPQLNKNISSELMIEFAPKELD